jgi:hypothetical protein
MTDRFKTRGPIVSSIDYKDDHDEKRWTRRMPPKKTVIERGWKRAPTLCDISPTNMDIM